MGRRQEGGSDPRPVVRVLDHDAARDLSQQLVDRGLHALSEFGVVLEQSAVQSYDRPLLLLSLFRGVPLQFREDAHDAGCGEAGPACGDDVTYRHDDFPHC